MSRRRIAAFAVFATLITAVVVVAKPAAVNAATAPNADVRVPMDPSEILEKSQGQPVRRKGRAAAPTVEEAVSLAQAEIDAGRASGDPRALGRAKAALGGHWDDPAAPASVVLLRATILQSLHEFERADAELTGLLARSPENDQARLTLATIRTVRADYKYAETECPKLSDALSAAVCLGNAWSLTGRSAAAEVKVGEALGTLGQGGAPRTRAEIVWAISSLGEYAERQGARDRAEAYYRKALQVSPSDPYVLRAYADLLLDLGRPAEVLPLLASYTEQDALLLRVVVAKKRLGQTGAVTVARDLAERFAAVRLRGDRAHLREESWYEREIVGDAARALTLAQENWSVQREPADARVFLEAARAKGDLAAAAPVRALLAETHLEDPTLLTLARSTP